MACALQIVAEGVAAPGEFLEPVVDGRQLVGKLLGQIDGALGNLIELALSFRVQDHLRQPGSQPGDRASDPYRAIDRSPAAATAAARTLLSSGLGGDA